MDKNQRAKEYYKKNKDKILEKKHDRYVKNHGLSERKNEIMCICGAELAKSSIYNHYNSKRHKDLVGTDRGYTIIKN